MLLAAVERQSNREIVLEAVKQNVLALSHASAELKADREIMLVGHFIQYLRISLRTANLC